LGAGLEYRFTVTGSDNVARIYAVEPGVGGISPSADWDAVLAEFKRLIELDPIVTASYSAATRELTLRAVAANTPFTLGDLSERRSTTTPTPSNPAGWPTMIPPRPDRHF
jgi:hypothetical protein